MGNNPSKAPPTNKWQYVPRSAKKPGPPGRPDVVPPPTDPYLLAQMQPDVITVRWRPPESDGGTPVTGYLVERRDMGATVWVRAHAAVAREPEVDIAGLEPGRRYQFRVSAENALGLSEPSEPSAPLAVSSGSVATVPHFMKELKHAVAVEHEKVTFSVHVLGTPTPHISWYKDAFEVFNSRRIRVSTENERSSITFYQVGLSDEGEIKCTATNRAGHVVTKARLRVEAPPKVKMPKPYEEGLIFELDDVIRLKATLTGRPSPIITWLHNGEELQNDSRCEIVSTERSSSMRLLNSGREDRGEYQIRAHNELGEDIASVLVTVTDRPRPPTKLDVIGVRGRSVMLEWEAPEDDGGCKIGNYVVEYYRIGWNVWLKAATCRYLTATLDDLIEGSEYKFRVKAENPYGMSDPGDESSTVFIPDPKRGLFKPPSTTTDTTATTIASDEWLEERRRRRAAMFEDRAVTPPEKQVKEEAIREDEEEREDEDLEDIDEEDLEGEDELDYSHMSEDEEGAEEVSRAGSELMLVLVPDADKIDEPPKKKKEPLSRQQSLDAPPPMSLSAPELSALCTMGTIREMQPLQLQRNAVSSTELLHEKAMARLYQALAAEEAEAEKQRHEGMEAEDALEMQQEQDLPRAKITDTGQQDAPPPEKAPLKPALKKPKRKIQDPKPEDDLLDTKKTKSSSLNYKSTNNNITKTNDDLNVTIQEHTTRPLTPANGSLMSSNNRPTTPLSLKEIRPFTPELDNNRPISPYLRGPILHKYDDFDDTDISMDFSTSSRPTSPRSTGIRSPSPFSKVLIMDEPPAGYEYEPSPSPSPLPPKKVKVKVKRVKKHLTDDNLDGKISPKMEPEVFKIPQVEFTAPEIPKHIESPILKVEPPLPETPKVKKIKKVKVKKEKVASDDIIKESIPIVPIEIIPETPKMEVEPIIEEPKLETKPKKGVLKKPKREKIVAVEPPKSITPIPEEPVPEVKEPKKGGLKTKLKKVKEKFPSVEKRSKEVKIVEPLAEVKDEVVLNTLVNEGVPEKPSKEKKTKEKKEKKEKKSKKDKTEKVEGEENEKPKAKKGFSILGVKLRRPTEMMRGGDDDDDPKVPRRKKSNSRQIPQVRLSSSSSFDKAEEEKEARQIVVDRYGELINDLYTKRSVTPKLYLDREELLKAVAGDEDEDPLEEEVASVPSVPSSPLVSRGVMMMGTSQRSGKFHVSAGAQAAAAAVEEHVTAPVKNSDYDDVEGDEDASDWEEESSRMSELPPSPPRSATPSHQSVSLRPPSTTGTPRTRSSASGRASSLSTGESARATVSLMTNIAVSLLVLWLSITVDWHLGLAVALLVIARKFYVFAKAKFQKITGWGGLKKKERSPELEQPQQQQQQAILHNVPSTPPPSPEQLLLDEGDEGEGELEGGYSDELDYIQEEDEYEYTDDEEDYSDEHSIPLKPH